MLCFFLFILVSWHGTSMPLYSKFNSTLVTNSVGGASFHHNVKQLVDRMRIELTKTSTLQAFFATLEHAGPQILFILTHSGGYGLCPHHLLHAMQTLLPE